MAPDSADVEMEGKSSNSSSQSATRRKSHSSLYYNMDCLKLTNKGTVNRTADQEDEDTEQKIINEGPFPRANMIAHTHCFRRVQDVEEELTIPL